MLNPCVQFLTKKWYKKVRTIWWGRYLLVHLGEFMEKPSVKFMIEDIVGCKWSLSILDMLAQGINRPGMMTRDQIGLSTKVLNERLKKLTKYGIINKEEFPEVPPRVEYGLTEFGKKFVGILNDIRNLEREILD